MNSPTLTDTQLDDLLRLILAGAAQPLPGPNCQARHVAPNPDILRITNNNGLDELCERQPLTQNGRLWQLVPESFFSTLPD